MFKKYLESAFAKNVLTLVSATAIAQAINFLFSILLTRIYSPASFGAVSVFLSIISFVLVISLGKYDIALVTAPDKNDAKGLVSLGTLITIFITIIGVIVAWFIYKFGLRFYNNSPVRDWLYIIPISVLLLSMTQLLWMWNIREKRFKAISFLRPVEALVNNVSAILFKTYQAFGLLLGTICGQVITALLIIIISIRKDDDLFKSIPMNKLKALAVKYAEFPRINIIQGFVDMFQVNALTIILSGYYQAQYIGLYSLCIRVLQVPARLIISPISNVFFSEASEMNNKGNKLLSLVRETTIKTALIILPFFILIVFAGPVLFSYAFGNQWNEAGYYARILAIWFYVDMVKSPITQVAYVLGKQRQFLYLSVAGGGLLLISVFGGVFMFSSLGDVLALAALSQVIAALLIFTFIIKWTK